MAHFIGTAGDFQKEKALTRRLNNLMVLFVFFSLIMCGLGVLAGFAAGRRSLLSVVPLLIAAAAMLPGFKLFDRLFDKQLRLARNEEDGANGECQIIPFLKKLPDTYTVVSDLDFADSFGNIDHLVIGPTGLFALDVKNWRGNVTADGKGELLCNGQPTDKPQVRCFTRRVMDLKDRLRALTKLDPFIQCVFVFPHTHIQAKWGTTGPVHCIHAHQLPDYLEKNRPLQPIPPADLPRIISAARALKDTIARKPPDQR